MILIDTEILKQLAASARAAVDELDSASQLLNQITDHNDWGCRERVAINDCISQSRQKMQRLQESAESFCSALTVAANDFVQAESRISSLFGNVESTLQAVMSGNGMPGGCVIGKQPSGKWQEKISKTARQLLIDSSPISVCNFSEISDKM